MNALIITIFLIISMALFFIFYIYIYPKITIHRNILVDPLKKRFGLIRNERLVNDEYIVRIDLGTKTITDKYPINRITKCRTNFYNEIWYVTGSNDDEYKKIEKELIAITKEFKRIQSENIRLKATIDEEVNRRVEDKIESMGAKTFGIQKKP